MKSVSTATFRKEAGAGLRNALGEVRTIRGKVFRLQEIEGNLLSTALG